MVSDFLEQTSKLIHNHVKVTTNIKRKPDFKCDFLDKTSCDTELTYAGFLKAVDPVTKSVILSEIDIDNKLVLGNILILGQHVKSIQSTGDEAVNTSRVAHLLETDSLMKVANHPFFKREPTVVLSEDQLKSRQREIMEWLEKARIPVELNETTNEIVIAEIVKIRPPYEHVSDYVCPTRIVLKRIKHIIDSRDKQHDDIKPS